MSRVFVQMLVGVSLVVASLGVAAFAPDEEHTITVQYAAEAGQ